MLEAEKVASDMAHLKQSHEKDVLSTAGEIERLQSSLAELRQSHNEEIDGLHEVNRQALQKERDNLAAIKQVHSSELVQLKEVHDAALQKLRAVADEKDGENKDLQIEILRLQSALESDEAAQALAAATAEHERLAKEASRKHEIEIARLEGEVRQAKQAHSSAVLEVEAQKESQARLDSELQELKNSRRQEVHDGHVNRRRWSHKSPHPTPSTDHSTNPNSNACANANSTWRWMGYTKSCVH